MIRTLNLPVELIYCEKGNKGYETYMADDPTGINQVLDKMYGAAFKIPMRNCIMKNHPSSLTVPMNWQSGSNFRSIPIDTSV